MTARAARPGSLRPRRWCVLISGRGSNLAALLEKNEIEIHLVVSSDPAAAGIAKARRSGAPVLIAPRKSSGGLDWSALDVELRARSIDAIFLLGFMRIVPRSFVEAWAGRILNLHPSLLPKYPGLRSIERAFEAGDDIGPTIHEVVTEVDAGPLLISRRSVVASKANQTARALEAAELFVHIDEQRIVKEIVEAWRP